MTKTRLLMLEVTSHCNMHCTFCPSDDLVRKKGHVSDEQAIQLIRSARDLAPPRGNYRQLRDLARLPPLRREHHDPRHAAYS